MSADAQPRALLTRVFRYLRRRFVDAPRGFGHPVPAAAFDQEFRSGHWRLLDSPDELARYAAITGLIRHCHPHPRLLDAGCGCGRLAASFNPDEQATYHGIDLSSEALRQAQKSVPTGALFMQGDLETWHPPAIYDVIAFNEVIGYLHDPAATLARLASALAPEGCFVISLYRWGNSAAVWRRLARQFTTLRAAAIANADGDKTWDIRILAPDRGRGSRSK